MRLLAVGGHLLTALSVPIVMSAMGRKQTFIPASRIASAASEQRAAVQEVRARAAAVAARLFADQHDANAGRVMVDQTIAGLGRTH